MMRYDHRTGLLAIVGVLAGLLPVAGRAQPAVSGVTEHHLVYSGNVDKDGVPFAGTLTMELGLYDVPASGTARWREAQDVIVEAGRFSVLLGRGSGDGAAALRNLVQTTDRLYLDVSLQEPGKAPVQLGQRRSLHPLPAALAADAATDLRVAGGATLNGPPLSATGAPLDVYSPIGKRLQMDGRQINTRDGPLYLNRQSRGDVVIGSGYDTALETSQLNVGELWLTRDARVKDLVRVERMQPVPEPVQYGTPAAGKSCWPPLNTTAQKYLADWVTCPDHRVVLVPSVHGWGWWGRLTYCPPNHYVCGLRQMVPPGGGDDTAVNALSMVCCPFAGGNPR